MNICIICKGKTSGKKYCRKCYIETGEVFRKGEQHSHWKGGRYITDSGYRVVRNTEHPFKKANGYIFEHRLVMEKYIGRYLKPEEIIHHINGNKLDNRIENLILTDYFEHAHRYDAHRPRRLCTIVNCNRKHMAHGLCKLHYYRANKEKIAIQNRVLYWKDVERTRKRQAIYAKEWRRRKKAHIIHATS